MQHRLEPKRRLHRKYCLLLVIFAVRIKDTDYPDEINTEALKVVFRSQVTLKDITCILRGRPLISLPVTDL
jgi:hypothetical protein